jgi:hypothetical protein
MIDKVDKYVRNHHILIKCCRYTFFYSPRAKSIITLSIICLSFIRPKSHCNFILFVFIVEIYSGSNLCLESIVNLGQFWKSIFNFFNFSFRIAFFLNLSLHQYASDIIRGYFGEKLIYVFMLLIAAIRLWTIKINPLRLSKRQLFHQWSSFFRVLFH